MQVMGRMALNTRKFLDIKKKNFSGESRFMIHLSHVRVVVIENMGAMILWMNMKDILTFFIVY
jgi:hypothetical protein